MFKEASIHGPLLHILLEDESLVEKLKHDTRAEARIIRPSLEDVFLSLARLNRRQVS